MLRLDGAGTESPTRSTNCYGRKIVCNKLLRVTTREECQRRVFRGSHEVLKAHAEGARGRVRVSIEGTEVGVASMSVLLWRAVLKWDTYWIIEKGYWYDVWSKRRARPREARGTVHVPWHSEICSLSLPQEVDWALSEPAPYMLDLLDVICHAPRISL